jgi:hypothetical protein
MTPAERTISEQANLILDLQQQNSSLRVIVLDLLAACEAALGEFDVGCNEEATPSAEYLRTIALLKAAVQKARGEE